MCSHFVQGWPSDHIAPQHGKIGIATKPGAIRHAHLAVFGHHQVVVRASLEIDGQPLERCVRRDRRVDVQRSKKARAEIHLRGTTRTPNALASAAISSIADGPPILIQSAAPHQTPEVVAGLPSSGIKG